MDPSELSFWFSTCVSGSGIKFPNLQEQSNKFLIPLANIDMIVQDYTTTEQL